MNTLELHIIQTYPASNPNRDNNGDPKSMVFGGVKRSRMSSQALKRAMREHMQESSGAKEGLIKTGVRTKFYERFKEAIAQEFGDKNRAEILAKKTWGLLKADKDTEDNSMIFVAQESLGMLVTWAISNEKDLISNVEKKAKITNSKSKSSKTKEVIDEQDSQSENSQEDEESMDPQKVRLTVELVKILFSHQAIDIALFGRMVAKQKSANVDGASMIAHAFGVHKMQQDLDFFTAVDDLSDQSNIKDNVVGMMDSRGFNSATYYRNLVLDIDQLHTNLGEDKIQTNRAIEAFIRAAVESYPKAMNRSYGAPSQPYAVVAMFRNNARTTNLSDTFLTPVPLNTIEKSNEDKHKSIEAMAIERLGNNYVATIAAYPKHQADTMFIFGKVANIEKSFPGSIKANLEDVIKKISKYPVDSNNAIIKDVKAA